MKEHNFVTFRYILTKLCSKVYILDVVVVIVVVVVVVVVLVVVVVVVDGLMFQRVTPEYKGLYFYAAL